MPYAKNGVVDLYYETFGSTSDPTLLLINGLGSQSINYRTEWCEMFAAEGFHVVRFDNRDVGLSTMFDAFEPDLRATFKAMRAGEQPKVPYTIADMAADAIAVLDAVGAATAHVMGLSMGGMIAQTVAIAYPDRVRSLVSVMSTTGESEYGKASDRAQEVFAMPPPRDRDDAVERNVIGKKAWGSPAHHDPDRLRAEAAEAIDRSFNPAGQVRQQMAIMTGGSRVDGLRALTVPTLVMHGTEDGLIAPDAGVRTAEVIPGARLVLWEGMGHDYPSAYWPQWVAEVTAHAKAADAPA
ncbi:MAG: alpha/beta fold hydrolase [Acidimicrobiales bacterium]